ncbi:MAG: histidine kinase dimerization/phospho-acceptor domain-containing protein [Candidatus Nitrosocosmicus sp.]
MKEAISYGINFLERSKKKIDVFADESGPSIIMRYDVYKSNYIKARSRGVKIRFMTEITNENIHYCKELKDFVDEIRHLDGIKGSISISESEFLGTTTWREDHLLVPVTYSNEKEIIEHQQFLFETLWNKAIPAEHKIREIEEGKAHYVKVIKSTERVLDIYLNIIKSSESEIFIIFPTPRAFIRHQKAILLSKHAARERKVVVRLLIPKDDLDNEFVTSILKIENLENLERSSNGSTFFGNIKYRYIERMSDTKATILIVDRKESLVMELKDDTKNDFNDAIGLSVYSNSKPGVLSYVDLFENMWNQTDLLEEIQNKNKDLEKKTHELARKREELDELLNKLIIQDKAKEEFIAMISHELRTPLVPIKGYTEILLANKMGPITEKQRKALQSIYRNVEKQDSLVSDILDVYRLDLDKINLRKKEVAVSDLFANVINDSQSLMGEKRIKIISKANKKAINTVFCDECRIEQVLLNLIKNSIDFVPEKDGEIVLSAYEENSFLSQSPYTINELDCNNNNTTTAYAVFTVKDNGPGIPTDKINNLL